MWTSNTKTDIAGHKYAKELGSSQCAIWDYNLYSLDVSSSNVYDNFFLENDIMEPETDMTQAHGALCSR